MRHIPSILASPIASRLFRRPAITRAGFLLAALTAGTAALHAQSVHTWNGGIDLDWGNAANWTGGVPDGSDEVNLLSGGGILTNVYSGFTSQYRLFFNAGAGAYTLNGPSTVTFFDFGGNGPKIENNSVNTQTINFGVAMDGTGSGGAAEINPVDGNLVFGSTVDLAGTTQLRIFGNNGKTVTFTGALSSSGNGGANSVSINQNSTVIFAGANTYTGDTFINAGKLQFAQGSSSASAFLRLGDTAGAAAAELSITDVDGGTIVVGGLNVRSGSSGAKTITATNTSGTNTFSGSVFLDADVATSTATGGTLAFTGSAFDLKNQTLTVGGTGTTTIGGVVQNTSGSGKITKTGAGTLILTGANTHTGATTVSGGTLRATVNTTQNSLGTGAASVAGGTTLLLDNTNTTATTVTIGNIFTGAGLLKLNFAAAGLARNTVMNNVTGVTGTIQLSNAGANADKWSVAGLGTLPAALIVDNNSQLFVGAGTTAFSGGINVQGTGNSETRGAIRLIGTLGGVITLANSATIGTEGGILSGNITSGAAGTQTLTFGTTNSVGNATASGIIGGGTGTIALTKAAAGTLTLTGPNTYTGVTDFSGGIVNVASVSNYGAASSSLGARLAASETAAGNGIGLHFLGGTLQYTGATAQTTDRQMRISNAGATIDASGSVPAATLSFTYSAANLNYFDTAGARTLTLTGTNTGANLYALNIQDQAATAAATSLVKSGIGTWVVTNANNGAALNGANSTFGGFSGGTTISAGTLIVRAPAALGAAGRAVSIGTSATLDLQTDTTINALNTTITGTGATIISNKLTAATAGITHTLGTLSIGAHTLNVSRGANATTGTGGVTFGAVTLTGAPTFTVAANALLTLGAITNGANLITVNGAGNMAITGIVGAGAGGITKSAAGTLTVSGANTYTGVTTLSGGILRATTSAQALGTGAATLSLGGGTLQLANDTGLNFARNTTVTASSTISSDRLTAATPAVTHTLGTLSIGAQTLSVTRGANATTLFGQINFGAVTMTNNAIFDPQANAQLLLGAVGGAFNLTKIGAGILELNGAGNYSGITDIQAGTLRLSNAGGFGNSTAIGLAANGTTLDIRGTITPGAGKTLTMNSNTTGDLRSTLLNGANNNTWAGNIVAAGTGLVQINAATGTTLTVTGGVTSTGGAGTATLFSRGAGTVIYNGLINMGTDRIFNKTDAGTVIVNSTGNSWLRTQAADGQIQIGANNALANVEFTFGQASGTNGRLELSGFNQTVTRLNSFASSTGTNHILRNSHLTNASTLTFATPTVTTDTLKNVQVQGTANGLGTLHLVSNGLGRTEFEGGLVGANSWTVNSGTVAFTGTNNRVLPGSVTGLAAATIEKAGASTLAATSTWNNAGTTNITGGALVLGAGTAGAINVSDGATLSTGLGGGVLNSSAVTFGTAGATTYVPLLTNPLVAPLTATSLVNAGTTVTVAPQAGSFTANTTYRLLDYTSVSGLGGFTLAPLGSYPHITATLDTTTPGQVNLVVPAGGVDSLIWAGQTSGVWDVNTTSNFALNSSSSTGAPFYQGDVVAFGDTHDVGAPATPVTNSTITGGAVTIGNLTFNNSAVTYSVANALTGAGGITKTGTGAVTLSGINTYAGATSVSDGTLTLSGANVLGGGAVSVTGGTLTLSGANLLGGGAVSVTGGTLKIGNSDALRGAGSITVSGVGTFDANGTAVGTRYPELIASGTGVGGNGAIVNNGAAITNNSHFAKITLAGNTTWGGSGRYDLVAGQIFNGGAFTLTKTGTGELWYNPSAGSVLENVIVNQGVFGSQQANPLSATATVTVNTGGTHQFFSAITGQHNVVLNDGGIFRQANNTAGTLTGQVTLNGTTAGRNIQAISGGTLNIAGKLTGTGGFTVNEAGTVQLQNAANDYAGDTKITLGTLNFSATGIIPTTTNLIVDGGTFATGNLPRTVASLSGLGGTISGGNTLTTSQSTTTVWNGILNGTVVQMSGMGSLTLGGGSAGAGDNPSGNLVLNSGTVILAKGNGTAVQQPVHAIANGLTVNGGTLQLSGVYDNTTGLGTGVNLAPVGFNTATYVDQIFNNTTVNLNAGTFDLNGRQEAINGLANPAGAGGTITNTSATAAKLYVGHQNAATSFGGAINDGAGTVAIEKIGTGALTLTGTSNFTGGLTQTAGTVTIPTGATLGNTPITVTANTFTFDGTHGTGAIAVNGTSVFAGAGTSGGTLTAATGTTVRVGTASAGTAATTLTLGGLTLAGGTNLNLDYNTAGTTLDKVATTVNNGLSISGANPLNVVLSGAGWVPGTYPILTYVGTVQGTGASNATLVLSTPVGHSTVNVMDDLAGNVNLVVAGSPNKWVGNVNNTWDTATTLNWNATDNLFLAGDSALFDDTATTFTPNILANQTAAGVTFDNSLAFPYTLTSTGTFGIAGIGGLIKKNTGTVTISSANTYTGTTDVQQGTLIANYNTGTAQTVFAAASTINVAGGATFKAVANDANITLANNLTGSGLVVIDPHFTAGADQRDVLISGNNVGFTGTLRLSPTVIGDGNGTFRTNAALTPARAGGATIDVDAGGQAWISAATFANNFILTGHGYAEPAGGTPVAASGLTQYSGTDKGGIGAIRMDNGAVINGSITLDGSAKIMPYGGTGTIGGSIGVTNPTDILSVGGGGAGSTLILTGTNNVGANALKTVFVNSGGTTGTNVLQVGNLGTTGTLGTGDVTLYTDAAGAQLKIQRSDGYTLMQNVTAAHNGTATNLTKASFVVNTQGTGVSVNGNTIDLTDGTNTAANAGGIFVAGAGGGSGVNNAVFNIDGSSTVKTGTFFIGEQNGFSGTVNQSGTSNVQIASHLRVGHYPNNTSAYNISGGTFSTTANPGLVTNPSGGGEQIGGIYLGIDGTGIMNQSGGTVTTDWVVLDNRADTAAGVNMPDGIDRYNLSGGTLEIRGAFGITNRNATTEFAFTGGTIKNVGTGVNAAISGVGNFVIGTGGSGTPTIDTNGATNAVTVSRAFSGPGALVKAGLGTLNLNVGNTFAGGLTVNEGTVKLFGQNNGLSTAGSGTLTIKPGATVEANNHNTLGQATGAALSPLVIEGGTFLADEYNHVNSVTMTAGSLGIRSGVTQVDGMDLQTRSSILPTVTTLASATTASISSKLKLSSDATFTVANGAAATDLEVSGVIAGTGALTKEGLGTMSITSVSSYTGATTISAGTLEAAGAASLGTTASVAISTGGTLLLSGTGNQVADGAAFTMNGGTIRSTINGLDEQFGTLTLTENSVIDFGGFASGNTFRFADSAALTALWGAGKTLSIWNWTPGVDHLYVGTTSGGLTASQLGKISFYSGAPGSLSNGFPGGAFNGTPFDGLNGEVSPVPEPSSIATVMGLLGLIGWRERRKARQGRAAERRAIG